MSRATCFAVVIAIAVVATFFIAAQVGHERREHLERLIKFGIAPAEADRLVYGEQRCEAGHDH